MMSETDYQLIEQYLQGELVNEALHDFEQRLVNDIQLAKEVELAKEMNQFVKNRKPTNDTIAMMKDIGKKYKPQSDSATLPFYKKRKVVLATLMSAAAIFLLLIFSNLLNNDSNPYQEFFQHQPISGELKGTEININQAITDFNKGKYKSALDIFEKQVAVNGLEKPQYQLAQGICYLETQQFQKAKTIFNLLLETQQIYKNQATWYLALTSLKQEDFQKCKNLLSQIERDSAYFEKAQRLQELISSK